MAKTFQCPQCGKEYPRENRLAGKAVACACGRRFIVPALEGGSERGSSGAIPAPNSPAHQTPPERRRAAQPGSPPGKPARWTDPVASATPAPLSEDDLVSAPRAQVPPVVAAAAAPAPLAELLPAPIAVAPPSYPYPAPPAGAGSRPKPRSASGKKRSNQDSVEQVGRFAAGCVFFGILPAIGVVLLLSIFGITWWAGPMAALTNARTPGPAPQIPSERPYSNGASSSPQPLTANGEPLPTGLPITIWDGKKANNGGQLEFSVEYRLDGLSASPETKYFWIVTDRSQSKVEFPIPASVWKQRDRLAGQPKGVMEAQFQAPYQMHLERLSPGMRQREAISNVIRLAGN